MDQFQSSFVNEASELLVDLENALLVLEDNATDLSKVGEVFRVMHTLKGSASMFGFEKIGELTHHLETIYDQVRAGSRTLTKEVFDLTLRGLDVIQLLLSDPNLSNDRDKKNYDLLLASVVEQCEGAPEGGAAAISEEAAGEATYYVKVQPVKEIFRTGSNPLFLLEDLSNLGAHHVFARMQDVPSFDKLVAELCYTWWEVIVVTDQKDEIEDVFIFVEDECNVEIQELGPGNLLEAASFQEKLREFDQKVIDLDQLRPSEAKQEIDQVSEEASATTGAQKKQRQQASIRVSAEKVDELMNLVSQLVTMQASLHLMSQNRVDPQLTELDEQLEKLSRQLRDNAFGMSLIPVDTMLTRFRRLVRDISGDLGKKVQFKVTGADTELDKNIIERLIDPLMHIIRNSLDHGLEMPDERVKAGKPETGTVEFRAFYRGAYVHIEIKDDGKGIDKDRVFNKAVEKGIISEDARLTDKETFDLIFAAGFSTAAQVTGVSGRGVGMDVVKRNVSDLRGEIVVDSKMGEGTTIVLKLPLSLSIIDGLLVRIAETHYVIPLSLIEKCYEIGRENLVDNFNQLIVLEGEQIPFFHLRKEFGVEGETPEFNQLIVVHSDDRKIGVTFDEVVGELQAVIKPLGRYYRSQEIFSGSTILGDGTVALVLDTNRIVTKFKKTQSTVS